MFIPSVERSFNWQGIEDSADKVSLLFNAIIIGIFYLLTADSPEQFKNTCILISH